MGIAALGAGMMGLVRGQQMANEDRRKEEEAQFLKEQRDWTRADRAKADALEAGLKLVRPAGEYEDVDPLSAAEGVNPSMLPKTKVSRSDADVMRDQARVYQQFGKVTDAAQLTTAARGERRGAREDALIGQRDAIHKEAGEMIADLRRGDLAAFRAKWGERFNADEIGGPQFAGYKVQFNPEGTKTYLVDPKGTVTRESPFNAQTAREMVEKYLDARLSGLSSEDYAAASARDIARRQAGAAETTAGAAMRNAATMEQYRTDQKPLLEAQSGLFKSQAGYYDRMPKEGGGAGGANAAVNQQLVKLAEQYAKLTPEERKGDAGKGIIQQVGILRAKIDPLSVFGENKPPRPAITPKDLNDFATNYGSTPSNEVDPKTGKKIPIGQLPISKIRQYAMDYYGGAAGSDDGGLPDAKPPAGIPGRGRPIVVKPGEQSLIPEGAQTMSDPRTWLRESSRSMLGGVNYHYRDPMTNKKYSPEDYNRLLPE